MNPTESAFALLEYSVKVQERAAGNARHRIYMRWGSLEGLNEMLRLR
jgi:hypothetical protein